MASHDDVRSEATKSLAERPIDSLKTAFKFSGGVGIALTAVGSGLRVLQQFDGSVFTVLVIVAIMSLPIAFVWLEMARLRHHSRMLRAVLGSERNFDVLIEGARNERDDM